MKAFKKLMAAALVCVMALSMLTGCAMSDKIDEKALVKALNAKNDVYVSENGLDDEATEAWKQNSKDSVWNGKKSGVVTISGTVYNFAIEEVPDAARKKANWSSEAGRINDALKASEKNKDKKIEIGIDFITGKKDNKDVDYVVVVAKKAATVVK